MPIDPDYDVEAILREIEPLCVGMPIGYKSVLLLDRIMYGPPKKKRYRLENRANYAPMAHQERPSGPGEWATHAACVGQRMYYDTFMVYHARPSRKDREMEAKALETCFSCPVLAQCQKWALQEIDPAVDHVAGGMTPRERAEWRRKHRYGS